MSWRLIFLINVPLAVAAAGMALRHVPETRSSRQVRPDIPGAVLITGALAALSYAAIDSDGADSIVAAVVGAAAFCGFLLVERASPAPMLPLGVFGSRQFTGRT